MFKTAIKGIQPDKTNTDFDMQMIKLVDALGLIPRNSPENRHKKTQETTIYKLFLWFLENPEEHKNLDELSEILGVSRPTVNTHIIKLVDRKLVSVEKKSKAKDVTIPHGTFTRDYEKSFYYLTGGSLQEALKAHNTAVKGALTDLIKQGNIVTDLL